jgi:hypothetical protein
VELTDSGRPQTECGRDFLYNLFAIFHLTEKDSVILDLLDTGTSQHLNTVTIEATLYVVSIVFIHVIYSVDGSYLGVF